jgi:energy-coupling factor transporter ATP-binding protein EcfA2
MYEQYWGLREKPFRKTPDPRYLFLNDTYEEALERLQFAVEEMELALLTGEVGSGKTLLTRALVDKLGERYEIGMILNPRLSPRQFLRTTAAELGVKEPRFHASDLLDQIHARLLELDEAGRAALLIIDEAHLIPAKPTVRGDPPAHELPARRPQPDRDRAGRPAGAARAAAPPRVPRADAADRRGLSTSSRSRPRTRAPTSRTGCRWPALRARSSAQEAIERLHEAAAGIPRLLNQLATQSLLEGMARGAKQVDAAIVERVASERDLSAPVGARG